MTLIASSEHALEPALQLAGMDPLAGFLLIAGAMMVGALLYAIVSSDVPEDGDIASDDADAPQ